MTLEGCVVNVHFSIQKRDGYLLVEMAGTLETSTDVLLVGERVVDEAKKYGCRSVILDAHGVSHALDLSGVCDSVELLAEFLPKSHVRLAAVRPDGDNAYGRAFETLLQRRLVQFKAFGSQNDAVSWLMQGVAPAVEASAPFLGEFVPA